MRRGWRMGRTTKVFAGCRFYETPNLDRLAAPGLTLTRYYHCPNCQPTRAGVFQHFPGHLGAGPDAWRTTPAGSIHSGDWKLLEFFEDERLELYNLRDAPGETGNLASSQPVRARQLQEQLIAWRRDIGAKMPTPSRSHESPAIPVFPGRR